MKQWLLAIAEVGLVCTATAMDIGDGIRTGDQVRLERAKVSDNAEAIRIIQASFDRVMAVRGDGNAVTLRITSQGVGGEAALGEIVMIDESLAALPEDERDFEIAHELGHIDLNHYVRMIGLFRSYVGMSTDDHYIAHTLNVHADELSPALRAMEFEADAYGQALLDRIPGSHDGGIHTFQRNAFRRGDFSHPTSRERLLRLQASLVSTSLAQSH